MLLEGSGNEGEVKEGRRGGYGIMLEQIHRSRVLMQFAGALNWKTKEFKSP